MKWGDIRFLDAPEPLLAIVRTFRNEAILAVFNLGGDAATLPLPAGELRVCGDHGLAHGRIEHGRILLPGYSALFAEMDAPPLPRAGNAVETTAGA